MKPAIQSFNRQFARVWFAMLLFSVLLATATQANPVGENPAAVCNGVRAKLSDPREAEARELERIAFYYGHTFLLTTDHLYQEPGYDGIEGANADKRFGYALVPVWQTEPANVVRVMQTTCKTWRVWVRTESGIEGYLEISNLVSLSKFLQPQPLQGAGC
jgi:hypothetical protein